MLEAEDRAWDATFGATSDLRARFPPRSETPAMARLISTAGVLVHGGQSAPSRALGRFVEEHRHLGSNEIPGLPTAAAEYLEAMRKSLDEIESALLADEPLGFGRDVDALWPEVFPMGRYVFTQSTLVGRALQAARSGEREAARRTLEAGWRLRHAACAEPEPNACAVATLRLNAVARSLASPPDEWQAQFDAPRASVTDAFRLRSLAWRHAARRLGLGVRSALGRRRADGSLWPWVRDLLMVPWFRWEAARSSARTREQFLRARTRPCLVTFEPFTNDRATPLGELLADSLEARPAMQLDAMTRFDGERTRLVLDALAARRRSGVWPTPSVTPSVACQGTRWTMQIDAADRLVIAPSPDPVAASNTPGRWTYTVSSPVSH